MKKGIHPKLYETTITCACGNSAKIMATRENLHVEICSKCHPFFTGKEKVIDKGGRIERFKKKYKK